MEKKKKASFAGGHGLIQSRGGTIGRTSKSFKFV